MLEISLADNGQVIGTESVLGRSLRDTGLIISMSMSHCWDLSEVGVGDPVLEISLADNGQVIGTESVLGRSLRDTGLIISMSMSHCWDLSEEGVGGPVLEISLADNGQVIGTESVIGGPVLEISLADNGQVIGTESVPITCPLSAKELSLEISLADNGQVIGTESVPITCLLSAKEFSSTGSPTTTESSLSISGFGIDSHFKMASIRASLFCFIESVFDTVTLYAKQSFCTSFFQYWLSPSQKYSSFSLTQAWSHW